MSAHTPIKVSAPVAGRSFSFTERDRERPLRVWKINQAVEERSTQRSGVHINPLVVYCRQVKQPSESSLFLLS